MARAHFNPDHGPALARKAIKDEIAGWEDCISEWKQAQADALEDGELGLARSIGPSIIGAQDRINELRRQLAGI